MPGYGFLQHGWIRTRKQRRMFMRKVISPKSGQGRTEDKGDSLIKKGDTCSPNYTASCPKNSFLTTVLNGGE